MRVLLFSDLHAHNWAEFSQLVSYQGKMLNSRLVDALRVIEAVRRRAKRADIDAVVFAGDLFHRKRLIDVPVFNAVSKSIRKLARVKPLYLLAGNHDLARRSADDYTTDHALYAYAGFKGVTVIDQPTVVLDGALGMVPYASERDTLLSGIESVESAKALVLHTGVMGATTGPIEYQPFEALTVDDLPKRLIFAGHYHAPQTVLGKVHYIGAPLEQVRGDTHSDERGYIIADLTRGAYERVPLVSPRFVSVASNELDVSAADVQGNFVDLRVVDAAFDVERHVAELQKVARAVNVVYDVQAKTKKSRLLVRAAKGKLPTLTDLCSAYVDAAPAELDKARLRALYQQAFQEADARGDA